MVSAAAPAGSQAALAAVVAASTNTEFLTFSRENLPENSMFVELSDGKADIRDLEELKKMHLFKTFISTDSRAGFVESQERLMKLPEIPREIFKAVFALIVEKKPLHQAISRELLVSADFFETFTKAIDFLHPGYHLQETEGLENPGEESKPSVEFMALKNELPLLLTLRDAKEILALNSEKNALASSGSSDSALNEGVAPTTTSSSSKEEKQEKVELQNAQETRPYLVIKAEEMLIQEKTFATQQEAEEYFDLLRDLQIEREHIRAHKMQLEASLVKNTNRAFQTITTKVLAGVVQNMKTIDAEIASHRKKADLMHLPKLAMQRLATHAESQNATLRRHAQTAKAGLEVYREYVMSALRSCGANLARQEDLLEYLIGPKAYFLDYYGFEINITAKPQYPFTHGSHHFQYLLENNSIYDLENEMRDDLARVNTLSLPPALIEKRIFSKIQTKEAQEIRKECLPVLRRLAQATDEEVIAVKQCLIDHFGWNTHGLTPGDVRIHIDDKMRSDEKIVIIFSNWRQSLTLNFWDVSTVYIRPSSWSHVYSLHQVDKMVPFEKLRNNWKIMNHDHR